MLVLLSSKDQLSLLLLIGKEETLLQTAKKLFLSASLSLGFVPLELLSQYIQMSDLLTHTHLISHGGDGVLL